MIRKASRIVGACALLRISLPPILEVWKEADREIHLKVRGDSMSPLIQPGDLIALRWTEPQDLQRGDILAFWQGEQLVVHRLIKKREVDELRWLCQKGDNLSGWSWIREDQVLGKVESIQRADRTRDMTRWPWSWINPMTGFAASSWITVIEWAQALRARIFGHWKTEGGEYDGAK